MQDNTNRLKSDYAKLFDHTMLKPDASESEIRKLCQEAIENKFASVCVNLYHADLCRELLKASPDVKLCNVIGFPLGATTKEVKEYEAIQAIKKGADEIDMVMNIGALKSKNYKYVEDDIQAVVHAAKANKDRNVIVKVIIETCLLTDAEKEIACSIVSECKADFVKTSTGFSKAGANIADIRLMREVVGNSIKVKASGGIRTKKDVDDMISAGADRIGASASVSIVNELNG